MSTGKNSIHCDGCGCKLEQKPVGIDAYVVVRTHTVLTRYDLDQRSEKRLCGSIGAANGEPKASGCMATRHYPRAAQNGYLPVDIYYRQEDQQDLLK